MNNLFRYVVFAALSVFTVLFLNKGLDLWSLGTGVNGDGIGVHFIGIEINDRVNEKSIPTYAIGFIVASLIPIVIAIAFFRKTLKIDKR